MIYAAIEYSFLREYFEKIKLMTPEQRIKAQELYANYSNNELLTYKEDTAIIKIKGVLNQESTYFSKYFGYAETAYNDILNALEEVENNKEIKNILLDIDSPGGFAEQGLDHVWQKIYTIRNNKNVIAINNGMMASAAYWIASSANKIYSQSDLNQQGSIGVYAVYYDWTEYDKDLGIKEIKIRSSNAPKKNRDVSDKTFIDDVQRDLDFIENKFFEAIEEGRGISREKIIKDFGQGALLLTKEAIDSSMIDAVKLQKEAISSFSTDSNNAAVLVDNIKSESEDRMPMTLDQMLAEHPELNAQFEARVEARSETKAEKMVKEAKEKAFDRGVAEGRQAADKEIRDTYNNVIKFIGNDKYSKSIHELAISVIEGKSTVDALNAVVAYEDRLNAEKQTKDATDDDGNKIVTPSHNPKVTKSSYETTGVIETEEDLKKALEKEGK